MMYALQVRFKPNDACSTDVHTAGTAAATQFSATAESKDAVFSVMGKNCVMSGQLC